jgi:general secretion pathway protein A
MANHELMNETPTKSLWDRALPPRRSDVPGLQKAKLQPISGLLTKLLYEWYGILENPFGVTPNARYLYESKTHAEARSSLIVGIESGIGFQALIAPPGMGKTTILFQVLERFKDVARTALLFQIHGDSHDFLRYLLSELGSDAPDSSATRLQEAINQLLVREFRSGRRVIVVIDEAQSLDTPVLETIRLLSNFETQSEKLLQIILAGQPQLAQRLANPELAQLNQRISILTTLIPFGLKDTKNYIEHRLTISGYQGPPLFTSAALRLIWEHSGGIPREINTLCFNALLLARTAEQKQADLDILSEVVADRDLDCLHFNTERHASVMRDVQTANRPRLGNAASDPAATSNDKICKAAVSGAKAEADEPCTRPTAFDRVDLLQLGTIAAGAVSTSSKTNVNQAAVPGTGKKADDMGGTPVPNRPALVTHHKTDVVTFADARAGGLPSCETAAMMRPNLTEQQLRAIASPGSGDRFDQELVAWFALCGGAWSGTAAEMLAAVKTRVGVGNDLWAQSPSALYAHIESHRQILRSLGVDVSLRHGYPRMVSLRSCQDEKPARKPMSVNWSAY